MGQSQRDAQTRAMKTQIMKPRARLKKLNAALDKYVANHKALGVWQELMKNVNQHRSTRQNKALQ